MCHHIKGHVPTNQLESIKCKLGLFSHWCLQLPHIPGTLSQPSFHDFIPYTSSTMDALQYWPFAWEYSIWNATVSVLQFWMEDLEPHVLCNAIDWIYTAFFYGNHTQQIRNLPEEILFSCFMTTPNVTFEVDFTQEDEGYESGRENFGIPTHSTEPCESTMSPWWMLSPSTL